MCEVTSSPSSLEGGGRHSVLPTFRRAYIVSSLLWRSSQLSWIPYSVLQSVRHLSVPTITPYSSSYAHILRSHTSWDIESLQLPNFLLSLRSLGSHLSSVGKTFVQQRQASSVLPRLGTRPASTYQLSVRLEITACFTLVLSVVSLVARLVAYQADPCPDRRPAAAAVSCFRLHAWSCS